MPWEPRLGRVCRCGAGGSSLPCGGDPKVISERLGHATVAITLDIYSHAIPALQQDAAVIVADLVTGVTPAGQG